MNSTLTRLQPLPASSEMARSSPWRNRYLVALSCLTAYSTGVAWQAQLVSYPLYRSVGAEDFLAYHARYNETIPGVVIVPGFLTFLAGIAFYWARPAGIGRAEGATVSIAGLVSLLTTVLWAIPAHIELDRIGQSAPTIDRLLTANLVRSAALTVGMVVLAVGVARLLPRKERAQ
jgi:hypothetical protein